MQHSSLQDSDEAYDEYSIEDTTKWSTTKEHEEGTPNNHAQLEAGTTQNTETNLEIGTIYQLQIWKGGSHITKITHTTRIDGKPIQTSKEKDNITSKT